VGRSTAAFDGQGLSERVRAVREALLEDLPASYGGTARIVKRALREDDFTGWMIWPVADAVALRALASKRDADFEAGLALLADLTGRLTSEFALRLFLDADLDRTLRTVVEWTAHSDEHVRRLASEGTRPRLPWAKRVSALVEDPSVTLPILDALHRDESEYVRRSVANHLNDISRIDPSLAVEAAGRWLRADRPETTRLVKHALRTLVKQGDPPALALLGFSPPREVEVAGPRLSAATVAVGERLVFDFEIANLHSAAQNLAIDYVIHHRKANGSLSPKVFKLTTRKLGPGERTSVVREHSFKQISTRRYHLGPHAIELQLNGVRYGRAEFDLVAG
jgi:3-methyladenine DNA glycosylase AlkC